MQTATERRWKCGDTHPATGKVFWAYVKDCKNGEYWVSPEKYRLLIASAKTRYAANRGKVILRSKNWAEMNREARLAASRTWRKRHPDKKRADNRRWWGANPHKRGVYNSRRRAGLAKASVALGLEAENTLVVIYATAKRVSNCLGIPHHVDHIIPLSKGGLHHPSNLQVLPAKINLRKSVKLDFNTNLA